MRMYWSNFVTGEADYREAPPTDREIREYVGIIAETEYHESDMHIHDATVTGWGPQGG